MEPETMMQTAVETWTEIATDHEAAFDVRSTAAAHLASEARIQEARGLRDKLAAVRTALDALDADPTPAGAVGVRVAVSALLAAVIGGQ